VGKLKKVGIGIAVSLSLVFVVIPLIIGMSIPAIEDKQALDQINQISVEDKQALDQINQISVEDKQPYQFGLQSTQMNDQELNTIAVDWNYRDLLRNTDDYTGKIIFVEGKVSFVARDSAREGELRLCMTSNCHDESFIVKSNGIDSWIEEDMLQGYVEVTGKFWNNSVPKVKEIKLTCSNC